MIIILIKNIILLNNDYNFNKKFEYKPFIEKELKNYGVKTLNWLFFSKENLDYINKYTKKDVEYIIRSEYSNGGVGVKKIKNYKNFNRLFCNNNELLSISQYLKDSISLNVGCCISYGCLENKTKSIHGVSIQLIGDKKLTDYKFGYCGNDFSIIKNIFKKESLLKKLYYTISKICLYMQENNYIGSFGIDLLFYKNEFYFVEINPRFQGSSYVSSLIDKNFERNDIFINHINCFLNKNINLNNFINFYKFKEYIQNTPDISHTIHHKLNNDYEYESKFKNNITNTRLLCNNNINIYKGAIKYQNIYNCSII
jgi:predicted ATP-grasp superfamily ATP-dependent carboligase